ncbi:MAG TPA: OmpH family outer membrane protein [Firmicutes bacterium]|nr:OmpH family outer membrane protein [Bacillota bacterium]
MRFVRDLRNRKVFLPVIVLAVVLVALGAGVVWKLQAAGVSLTSPGVIGYVNSSQLINAYLASPPVDKVLQSEKSRLEKEMESVLAAEKDEKKKQEIVNRYQAQLNARVQQEVDKLNVFIAQVAKEKNVAVVLDGAAVLYGGVDLTADVMKKAGISPPATSPTGAAASSPGGDSRSGTTK